MAAPAAVRTGDDAEGPDHGTGWSDARTPPNTVYVGREVRDRRTGVRFAESRWFNPFKFGRDGSREEVIAKYRARLLRRPQQQVGAAARLVARHLTLGHSPDALIATLTQALLREDAGFHAY